MCSGQSLLDALNVGYRFDSRAEVVVGLSLLVTRKPTENKEDVGINLIGDGYDVVGHDVPIRGEAETSLDWDDVAGRCVISEG
jgi:hypothetical protein